MNNGVAIGVRKDIRYKLIDDFETYLIGITVDTEQGNIHIVTSYIPPRDSWRLAVPTVLGSPSSKSRRRRWRELRLNEEEGCKISLAARFLRLIVNVMR